ncbi:MAG TPA: hypothetical protein VJK02_05615 [Anaerolineales bacterium]|jgi:hypothetical protein|nr:hypothetical protein [Anaerolineales bacterium]
MVESNLVNAPVLSSPAKPLGVLAAFVTGFERIAEQPILILPPLLLDLFLWLGPRLSLSTIFRQAGATIAALSAGDSVLREQAAPLTNSLELLADRFNLFSALNSMPVGVPSLMAGRLPVENALGTITRLEFQDPFVVLGLWVIFTVLGLGLGAMYHRLLARRVAPAVNLASAWRAWLGFIILAVLVYLGGFVWATATLLAAAIAGVILPLFSAGVVMIGLSLLFWVGTYLAFTPHGIIRYRLGVIQAMLDSALVVRWNTLGALGFIGVAIGVSWLTNLIWDLPQSASWFSILGLLGHAFVSAMIIVGSYAFYQARREWLTAMRSALAMQSAERSQTKDGTG